MTHTKTGTFFAAASVFVGTFGLTAQTAHAQKMAMMPKMDKMFVNTVSHSNAAEIADAKLALEKSKDEKVRTIATTIITDHGKAQDALKKLSGMYSMSPPMGPTAKQKAMHTKLASLSGDAFDTAYLKEQVKGHYAAVNLFEKEMAKGEDSQVRGYAAQFLPGIQYHTKLITAAASNRGIKTADKVGMTPAKMKRMDKMDKE